MDQTKAIEYLLDCDLEFCAAAKLAYGALKEKFPDVKVSVNGHRTISGNGWSCSIWDDYGHCHAFQEI